MNAHKVSITLTIDGEVNLRGLPFQAGETVEVIVLEKPEPSRKAGKQPIDVLLSEENSQQLNPIAEETLQQKWEKWFSQVDQLELSLNSPQDDYQKHLLNKYRQQGLEL